MVEVVAAIPRCDALRAASLGMTDKQCALLMVAAVELDILNLRMVVEGDAVGGGDGPQRGVNVGEMVGGDVAEKGAVDFVVEDAAMQPAEKQHELHGNRREREQRECVRGHRNRDLWLVAREERFGAAHVESR